MTSDPCTNPSNLGYRELRGAVLEALRTTRHGADDQDRLDELLGEVHRRICDGDGLVRFLEELRRAKLLA